MENTVNQNQETPEQELERLRYWLKNVYPVEFNKRLGPEQQKSFSNGVGDVSPNDRVLKEKGISSDIATQNVNEQLGLQKVKDRIQQLENVTAGNVDDGVRWFRSALKIKKPRLPKVLKPKSPKTKKPKVKKYRDGPRDPYGHRKRLYIPKKFIVAGLNKEAFIGSFDPSSVAISQIDSGRVASIDWIHDTVSDPECDCAKLAAGIKPVHIHDMYYGISGASHPGCDCFVRIYTSDGGQYRVVAYDSELHVDVDPAINDLSDESAYDLSPRMPDWFEAAPSQVPYVEEEFEGGYGFS